MFTEDFNKIFAEIKEIEEILETQKESCNKEEITNRLLKLRASIDQFIGYWIGFEEKLWELQQKYEINIPDQLDESLISAYLESSGLMEYLIEEDNHNNETGVPKDYSLNSEDNDENYGKKEDEELKNLKPIKTLKKGLGYYELFMFEEATQEFEKVVKSNPNMIIAHFYLALANAHKENYEESIKELKLVLALIKEEEPMGVIYNLIGNIYTQKKEYDKALIYFIRACECNPRFYEAHFNLGVTYFNTGEYSKSETAFKNTMEIKSGDWEVHLNLGKALSYQGKFKEALKQYKKALALNPKEGKIHFEMGLIYQLLQNNELAKKEYAKAKEYIKKKNHTY